MKKQKVCGSGANISGKIKCLCFILALFLSMMCVLVGEARSLPNEISIKSGGKVHFANSPYVSVSAPCNINRYIGKNTEESLSYDVYANLFGVVPIKRVGVTVTDEKSVYLGGTPVGIEMYTDGVVVADTIDVTTKWGNINPGMAAGIRTGDIITSVDGQKLTSAYELVELVEQSNGDTMQLEITDIDGVQKTALLTPAYSVADNCFRVGIWARDSSAGIGILTYIEPQSNTFGALGHAICDAQTGAIVPLQGGRLTDVVLTGIQKGAKGFPGELVGYMGNTVLGELKLNISSGVYGTYSGKCDGSILCDIALKHEVKENKAQIYTTLPGMDKPEFFEIEIEKINYDNSTPTRNMIIRVTDERLLKKTGGIVQGMSGSPIVQDGKLVGAVTHVLVNDPMKGYGIFIENMLDAAE